MTAVMAVALAVAGATARVLVAMLFLAGAMGKLRDLENFRTVLANYRLLPGRAVMPASLALVLAELVLAGGLIGWPRLAAPGAIALLLLFAFAMRVNIARHRDFIDCGCGLSSRRGISNGMVLQNLTLCVLLVPVMLPLAPITGFALANCAAAGVLLYLIIQIFGEMAALRVPRNRTPAAWSQI
ncbi:MauE/DoxX family redox-associated membrane protein [Novosphingobium beihaiensis]|uniref:Methylamine utilization protein MauE n=1 Tax=Novosphingobium beihaiensis TaxID=2930389 RepID=A0ABT0BLB6_9SPHN|nr:MauE/DoxX family redox-associated membrane protein [Novosphingobium beihaiensis]MCJ2185832.1 methylamine utilization protein MauE [Novosphingobium beihaiensis]